MKAVLVFNTSDAKARNEAELIRKFLAEADIPFSEADISRPLPDALMPNMAQGLRNFLKFLTRDDYQSLMIEWNQRVSAEFRVPLQGPALLVFEDQDDQHDYRFFGGFEAVKQYFEDTDRSFFLINRLRGLGYKGN